MIEQVILERLRVVAQGCVSRDLLERAQYAGRSAEVEVVAEAVWGNVICRLSSEVLAEKLVDSAETSELEVPATWWQHLKRDHFPAWFTRRWPVRVAKFRQTVSFQRHRTYPNASIALPPKTFGYPVIIERATPGWWAGA